MVRRKLLAPLNKRWLSLLTLGLVISLAGYCQGQVKIEEAPAKAKLTAEARSIAVGEAFPDFELQDQDGKSFTLKETLKKGPVVLVVYRSADW